MGPQSPAAPLPGRDVLITSDDERAANALRALARFAEGGQVLIFTHHHHLIDVARARVGRSHRTADNRESRTADGRGPLSGS
ncbi:MAG: hypothetical protein ACYCXT_02560 [Acidiferrobacteraceae bacterium]